MDVVQPAADSLVTSWPAFAQHVFDEIWPKVWPLLAAAIPSFLAGWLGLRRPDWAQRKPPSDASPTP